MHFKHTLRIRYAHRDVYAVHLNMYLYLVSRYTIIHLEVYSAYISICMICAHVDINMKYSVHINIYIHSVYVFQDINITHASLDTYYIH